MAVDEIDKIPKEAIISQRELPPAKFEMEEPAHVALAGQEAENEKAWVAYRNEKERFEATHADDKPMLEVNLWVPVKVTLEARMDGQVVKIFHTLRGPVMGLVKSEDMNRAFLYSPCFIDPNIERGRIHYLPIAFAGFEFTLYKGGMGESTPQESEIEGYPHFVSRNRAGDYTFRMKAAYHHIEADYPEDAKLISADGEPRDALMGLITTSDTREGKLIERGRQVQALQEQQAQAAQAQEEASEGVTSPPEATDEETEDSPTLALVDPAPEETPAVAE